MLKLQSSLMTFGVEALEAMYRPDVGLFPFTCWVDSSGLVKLGVSTRYTAIALVGLNAARRAGLTTDLDLERIMGVLAEKLDTVENIGDVGLIAWADAQDSGAYAGRILRRIKEHGEFFRTPGSGLYASMELAWLLTGLLALWPRASGSCKSDLESFIGRAYRDLAANYHVGSGLFRFARISSAAGHARQIRQLALLLKKNLCFFAEQIYGIQALALYSAWSGDAAALRCAQRTAQHLCELQGENGQWAWAYHAGSGSVIDRYPVYSVHQDGMAPMSLCQLSSITGEDFVTPALRGLEWVMGQNELQTSLVQREQRVIWRSIRRRTWGRKLAKVRKGLALLGIPIPKNVTEHAASLEIDRECRPYHLGWMLVALSRLQL